MGTAVALYVILRTDVTYRFTLLPNHVLQDR